MNNREREESVTLEILEAIEARSDVTQRHLARRTGIALGLANSYLKRCVRKGLVKMQQAPANRYLYYLTPKGFAEKSRLTAQYLSSSFTFYRRAADSCSEVFDQCKWAGWNHVALCGASDLAEIASLRAVEHGVNIVALYDPNCDEIRFANGMLSIYVDPQRIDPEDTFAPMVTNYINWFLDATPIDGADHVRMPGDLERERRSQRTANGLELPVAVWKSITDTAIGVGVDQASIDAATS